MEKVFNSTTGEIYNINEKRYSVIIGDSDGHRIYLDLSRVEFESINFFAFVELGFIVTINKVVKHV